MSSPYDEVNSSFNGRQEYDFDKSSPFSSYELNCSFTERRKNYLAIDRAIDGLNKCLQNYEEKASNCEFYLEKLGFSVKYLPEDLKADLKEALQDDDGVFNFPRAGSEMVMINADHVLDSLQEKYELGQLRMLSSQMETLVEEYSHLQNNLERKLNTEKDEAEKLENKQFDREANLMIFNEKLEAAMWELKNLQRLSKGNQRPKYSLDDLDDLKEEVNKLKSDIAFTNTKLNRFNKLPLNEKDVQKHLVKLKEDLKNVDDEIRKKVSY